MALLCVRDLSSGYRDSQVLWDVTLNVDVGQVVGILGRNGAGKSTLLRTLIGWLPAWRGEIKWNGINITPSSTEQRALGGMQIVPEERNVFRSLSVEENLKIAALRGKYFGGIDQVYEAFPRLRLRRTHLGSQLSGGEAQMLAVGRALIRNPKLLMLDEPLEGLAPSIVEELWRIFRKIKANGGSMLIIEQNVAAVLDLADYIYVLGNGRIVYGGRRDELASKRNIIERWVGVSI